jgi:2-octaprenyl-6-methoxyphenol hydroxylase
MAETIQQTDYDLIIVGGGMVGLSLAVALGEQNLKIAVIEAVAPDAETQPSFDARTIAMAYGTQRIFQTMGVWNKLEQYGVTAIKKIHVSDRGHLGSVWLDSKVENVPALGYVAETSGLGLVLRQAVEQLNNVTLYCPAQVINIDIDSVRAEITIDSNGTEINLTSRLVVAADGGNSQVRTQTGIKTFNVDYGQYAVIANVEMAQPHNNIAYERFTSSGPMALLPSKSANGNENLFALVWTVKAAKRDSILGLSDEEFLQQLQQRFASRVKGFVKISQRHVYPLSLMQSREHYRPRLAIIGNAAHTMHPVAGQGFNLGLRDVAAIAEVIVDAIKQGEDIGDTVVLQRYAKWRQQDQLQMAISTDSIVRIFSNSFSPLALVRNIGLTLLDISPGLKHKLTKHAMGFSGKLPRLARGIRL